MTTLFGTWHLLTGWFSVGAVVGTLAFALYVFSYFVTLQNPIAINMMAGVRHVCLVVGSIAFTASAIYGFAYKDGFNTAANEIKSALAQQDQEAGNAISKKINEINACYDAGGDWDVSRGVCATPR